jgi:hypothetical protein
MVKTYLGGRPLSMKEMASRLVAGSGTSKTGLVPRFKNLKLLS